jgi:hypothetical protein
MALIAGRIFKVHCGDRQYDRLQQPKNRYQFFFLLLHPRDLLAGAASPQPEQRA